MPWTTYQLAPTRYVLELDDRATPPGLALELEVHLVEGRSVGVWRLSETGRLLTVVVGRRA